MFWVSTGHTDVVGENQEIIFGLIVIKLIVTPLTEAKKIGGVVYLEVEIKSPILIVLYLRWLIDMYMAVSVRQFNRRVWSFKKRCQRYVLGVICTLIICKPMGLDDIIWKNSIDRVKKSIQNKEPWGTYHHRSEKEA